MTDATGARSGGRTVSGEHAAGEAATPAPASRLGRVITTLGLTATTAMVGCSESRSALDQGRFVNQLQTAIATAETGGVAPAGAAGQAAFAGQPIPGRPGECYAQVSQPAKYLTVTERVLIEPSIEDLETAPATFKTVTERVMIEPARERQVVEPATYKTITETIVVDPRAQPFQRVSVPAQFATRNERVKVRDGYTSWMRYDDVVNYFPDPGPGDVLDTMVGVGGETLYLVRVPPRYETRAVRQGFQQADLRFAGAPTPATRTITRRVLDRPAVTRTVVTPPVFALVTRRVVDQPSTTRRVVKPARYRTVTRQVLEAPAQTGWSAVLCEDNLRPDTVRALQSALRQRGLYAGEIDGVYGPQTTEAVRRFQQSSGTVTPQTLRSLGVAI